MRLSVGIMYEVPGHQPLRLVRIEDPLLLAAAAEAAIEQAEEKAIRQTDPGLEMLLREEAGRLRRILEPFIGSPGSAARGACAARKQR